MKFELDIPGMETLAPLLAGKPQNILVVAIAFLVGYLVPRFTALGNRRRFGSLLIASVAWGVMPHGSGSFRLRHRKRTYGSTCFYLADVGNSIGVGFVSSASITLSERPTTGCR